MPSEDTEQGGALRFVWRVTAAHMATYMVAGLLASTLMDYESWWATEWMDHYRPYDSPWIAAGMGLQVLRGLVLAAVLYPFREVFLAGERGWLKLWGLLVGVGVLSTYAASLGSIEGMIYTAVPWKYHLFGLPEVYGQALAFSACLVGWYRAPSRAWGWVLGTLTVLGVLMSLAGIFLPPLS